MLALYSTSEEVVLSLHRLNKRKLFETSIPRCIYSWVSFSFFLKRSVSIYNDADLCKYKIAIGNSLWPQFNHSFPSVAFPKPQTTRYHFVASKQPSSRKCIVRNNEQEFVGHSWTRCLCFQTKFTLFNRIFAMFWFQLSLKP